jgi:hypothetical protein
MARAGYENVERDNVYNGMTLREYARMALTERGIGVSSYNPMQMVGFALTHSTSDFGNILLDVANKALLQGWDEAAETFELWTKKASCLTLKRRIASAWAASRPCVRFARGLNISTSPRRIKVKPSRWPLTVKSSPSPARPLSTMT